MLTSMLGTVRSLSVKLKKGTKSTFRDSVQITPYGLDGDYHTGHSRRRQILLLSSSLLDEFGLKPGDLHENVVIDGIDVMLLREGQSLRLGDALVEVTLPCEACTHMDGVRPGLQGQLKDRRGMFVRVIEPGIVRVGDKICEEPAPQNSLNF
jgi:molybdopterin adenylyltransferase